MFFKKFEQMFNKVQKETKSLRIQSGIIYLRTCQMKSERKYSNINKLF